MTQTPFGHPLIPIADEGDAEASGRTITPYIDHIDRLTALHVIECEPDAETEADRKHAETLFTLFNSELPTAAETVSRCGPELVAEIFAAAEATGATTVGFVPRRASKLLSRLAETPRQRLIEESAYPLVVFPRPVQNQLLVGDTAGNSVNSSGEILVPGDGSAAAQSALEYACETYPEREVTVLQVYESAAAGVYGSATGGQTAMEIHLKLGVSVSSPSCLRSAKRLLRATASISKQ